MKKILIIAVLACVFLLRPTDAIAWKYRVEIDVAFDNEQDAVDLMNYIEDVKAKAYRPKGTEVISCDRKCRYHHCSHDEEHPVQCKDYINVEFDKEKKVHKIEEMP